MSFLNEYRAGLAQVPAGAEPIVTHALETFGTREKALHWLERMNPLFGGSAPIDILRTDPTLYEFVDDELTKIEHGVFV